jgi:hypothetical protein
MGFTLDIETANDAFDPERTDGKGPGPEVSRLLREVADLIDAGVDDGNLYDTNGNSAGYWTLEG